MVREWLRAGTELMGGIAADDTAATWLRAVVTIVELKQLTRARSQSTRSELRHEPSGGC
ncbi:MULTISPECIES: hypothetical protein [unclassified Streptomyces]|uniref:hypothetical protein n=1 Tax=unclassified Streptomyces TaxID=2593676 RepID=UPI002259392E|nr:MULTISPECIES: hypothetical protein [unclassified Streptomyces]WSP59242.1 hypothetical protein OG306_36330 [Streptomyces sp. NBC_01241]WSU20236.1 hypothetical protein OG508_04015 [Streptomyces sp. NBC_01108]MCX4790993.1 hypothetical protein [Streptomyces sp. NBC_01221]MCX4793282.1 hypothetical protein [Streptomyces sp. NBC_01242]WSJ34722.1 hypothetical protein OG772_00680 [Streptomyces sp. NBC_01321]